jgi:hypothetical protein
MSDVDTSNFDFGSITAEEDKWDSSNYGRGSVTGPNPFVGIVTQSWDNRNRNTNEGKVFSFIVPNSEVKRARGLLTSAAKIVSEETESAIGLRIQTQELKGKDKGRVKITFKTANRAVGRGRKPKNTVEAKA